MRNALKPYQVVILTFILAGFAGYFLGATGSPKWVDMLAAAILALAGSRWIGILRRRNEVL